MLCYSGACRRASLRTVRGAPLRIVRGAPLRIVRSFIHRRGFVRRRGFVHRGSALRVVPCFAVVRRFALLPVQIRGRFERRFGVGLGAFSDVAFSAI